MTAKGETFKVKDKDKPRESLGEIKDNWEEFARSDPLWSIMPLPEKKNNRWTVAELFKNGDAEIDALMEYFKSRSIGVRPGAMLDFGCGVGRLTQAAARYFAKCTGVDISEGMIALARKFNAGNEKCDFVVNNADDLGIFKSDSFDLIYSNIVFQHIPPVFSRGYIKEFLRIIKTDGIIVFQITVSEAKRSGAKVRAFMKRFAPRSLRRLYKQYRYGTWAIKDMYCIPRDELEGHISACGGQVVDVVEDPSSRPRFLGYRYCVRRKHQ